MKQDIGSHFLPHEFKNVVTDTFSRFEKMIGRNTDLVETVAEECREQVSDFVAESIAE